MADVARSEESQPATALLSCHSCRKRKVRCDRIIPSCSMCIKSLHPCTYHPAPLKPGPKPGVSRLSRKRPRADEQAAGGRLESDCDESHGRQLHNDTASRSGTSPTIHSATSPGSTSRTDRQSGRMADRSAGLTRYASNSQRRRGSSVRSTAAISPTANASSPLDLPTLSWIIHPAHESIDQNQECPSPTTQGQPGNEDILFRADTRERWTQQICQALRITPKEMQDL
jgi:hypothetical protein